MITPMTIHLGLKKLIILGLIVITATSYSQNKLKDTYPVPVKTDKLLFYLQRSKNSNTIIYELNTLPNGALNKAEPVHPYWLRYEEGGKKMELSYVQKTLAFGIDAVVTDKEKGNYVLTMVSYKGRTLFLQKRLINNIYRYWIFIVINGKISILQSIFVNSVDNYFGYPIVNSVELFGTDAKTGSNVYEKITV
jgi:hypothetical protein